MSIYEEKYIKKLFDEIKENWNTYLRDHKVKKLKFGSQSTYVLIYLYDKIGQPVSKNELTEYINFFRQKQNKLLTNDVQEARHLSQQHGYYILSGTRKDIGYTKYNIKHGEYMLLTLESPYPSYISNRRNIRIDNWKKIKEQYNNSCATCGSREDEKHRYFENKTILQKGHMDPNNELDNDNIIPQCNGCNKYYKNYFEFNNKGYIVRISNPLFVLKSNLKTKLEMYNILSEELNMNKINVIDLFSGVGGLSYGFHKLSKFNVILANENDKNTADAYSLNFKSTKMLNCCISELTEDKLKKCDVLIGGPPCQSYSTSGKRKMDKKANLFKEYHRILKIVKPKLFIFENVVGLLSMKKGKLLKEIISLFSGDGYQVQYQVLNSADYGIPQTRERVIIVGTSDGKFEYPKKLDQKRITLRNALSDLPELKNSESCLEYKSDPQNDYQRNLRDLKNNVLTEHSASTHNSKLIKLMKLLPEGGSPQDIPEKYRPTSGFKNSYCRLWYDKPSPTITRNFGTPSSARCIHPGEPRSLTTREGARLQSFPDTFIFAGSKTKKNLQIGNAVPPLLSIELAKSVKRYLNKN